MNNVGSKASRRYITVLLPQLVLAAPLLAFIEYHSYGYPHVEILLVFIGFAVVGLIFTLALQKLGVRGRTFTLVFLLTYSLTAMYQFPYWAVIVAVIIACLIFRERVAVIVVVSFLAMNISIVLVPERGPTTITVEEYGKKESNSDRPVWVHVILDEHIGLEGIPVDIGDGLAVRELLKSFYKEEGFRVFGGAYSRYFETDNALSAMVNFASSNTYFEYIELSNGVRKVTRNSYFNYLSELGYRINVYQSNYMDFCDKERNIITFCLNYPYNTINSIQAENLSSLQKSLIVLVYFANNSRLYSDFRDGYRYLYATTKSTLPWRLPEWNWDGNLVIAETTVRVIKIVEERLRHSQRGEAYFFHFLLPHHPYVYDSQCKITGDVTNRLNMDNPTVSTLHPNSLDSRKTRYELYFQQIQCATKQVAALLESLRFAGNLDDATIIIQGDHGSRIATTYPFHANYKLMTADAMRDNYSTLFAVKTPKLSANYDKCARAMEDLLKVVLNGSWTLELDCEHAPYVYMQETESANMIRHAFRLN